MSKSISIKSLLTDESHKIAEMVAELESSRALWTDRLTPSTKGGKQMGA
jgi:hypothetical protein